MPLGKGLVMTEAEKLRIHKLSQEGLGYKKIAAALGLPVNSVKTYLRRHPVGEDAAAIPDICERCGKPIIQSAPPKTKTVLLRLVPHLLVERPPRQRREAYPARLYLRLLRALVSERCESPALLLPHLLCRSPEKGGERRWMSCTSG